MKTTSDQLKSAELKITEPRKAVLDILSNSINPLDADTIKQLLDKKNISADQATVYRILKTFTDKVIVKKVILHEGKTHYELADRPHHHHIVCVSCGKIQDVEECGMDEMDRDIEKNTGFLIQSHSFELFGLCPECKKTK
ncbi:peroxide-responsive transcriptional repressor PerR [soil metagenome]